MKDKILEFENFSISIGAGDFGDVWAYVDIEGGQREFLILSPSGSDEHKQELISWRKLSLQDESYIWSIVSKEIEAEDEAEIDSKIVRLAPETINNEYMEIKND